MTNCGCILWLFVQVPWWKTRWCAWNHRPHGYDLKLTRCFFGLPMMKHGIHSRSHQMIKCVCAGHPVSAIFRSNCSLYVNKAFRTTRKEFIQTADSFSHLRLSCWESVHFGWVKLEFRHFQVPEPLERPFPKIYISNHQVMISIAHWPSLLPQKNYQLILKPRLKQSSYHDISCFSFHIISLQPFAWKL